MRGIILAGGVGTRLLPLTMVHNKQTLPVYDKPMIFHLIDYMKEAGIIDIMVITGREHCGDVFSLLGSGIDLGVELTYRVQEKADGIAGALHLCRNFARQDPVTVILGDNLFEHGIKDCVKSYIGGAMVFTKEVPDPERFGVVSFDENNKVTKIIEKPSHPETNHAAVGLYIYDHQVWDIIEELTPSARGEYEITDVNQAFLNLGQLHCNKIKGWWQDTGTIESLYEATLLMKKLREKQDG